MLNNIGGFIGLVGSSNKFANAAKNVTEIADTRGAITKAVCNIVSDCMPPQIKYPVRCLIFGSSLYYSVCTGGTPWSWSVVINAGTEIIQPGANILNL